MSLRSVLYNHDQFSVYFRPGNYDDKPLIMDHPTEICGLCGHPDADKVAQNGYKYPDEQESDEEFVHMDCEREEQNRAFRKYIEDRQRRGVKFV